MTVRGKDVMPLPPDVRDAVSRLAEGYRYARGMIQSTQVYSCPVYRVPEWVGEAKDAYMESIRRLGKHTHGFRWGIRVAGRGIGAVVGCGRRGHFEDRARAVGAL